MIWLSLKFSECLTKKTQLEDRISVLEDEIKRRKNRDQKVFDMIKYNADLARVHVALFVLTSEQEIEWSKDDGSTN